VRNEVGENMLSGLEGCCNPDIYRRIASLMTTLSKLGRHNKVIVKDAAAVAANWNDDAEEWRRVTPASTQRPTEESWSQ